MKDLYQDMTDLILSQVDEAGEWKPCWQGMSNGRPVNAVTGHAYRGVNILSCWVSAARRGFPTMRFASFKQWQDAGAQVRKGEKGTPIIFYKVLPGKAEDDPDRMVLKGSHVFNAAQVDGVPQQDADPVDLLDDAQRMARIEHWLATRQHAYRLTHDAGDQRAYYNPGNDSINMPAFGRFIDAEHYYSTLFHELTHWTGAKHRLDRADLANYRDERRAREELVAELGAAFLCAEHRIAQTTRDDHVSYVASWLKVLKNDKRAIVQAASLASAAVDHLEALAIEQRIAA